MKSPSSTSAAGLPAIGLLVSLGGWLPLALVGIVALKAEGDLGARIAFCAALVGWWWIQGRVGRALTVLDQSIERALVLRIVAAFVFASVVAIAFAMWVGSAVSILFAIPIGIALSISPVVLWLVTRRPAVRAHVEAARRGEIAYYGRDRNLAQVGVAMVFLHSFALLLKLPLIVAALVLGLVALDVVSADVGAAVGLIVAAVLSALSCVKSFMALRLGWAATQGTVDPAAFARRLRRYRIVSWVCVALLLVLGATSDGQDSVVLHVAVVASFVPIIAAWPELLARFVRRMHRETALAGAFVPDANRGLVVGGWMLLGTAVLTLLGTQLDWIPVVGMVAAAVHPGATAAWIYGLFALWAAIEALGETTRARLAVALFGAYSLVYLPIAALLVVCGVGEPTHSVTQIAGFRADLVGGLSWLAPLVPILLLTYIALGRRSVRP